MSAWTQFIEPGPALLLIICSILISHATAAPTLTEEQSSTEIEYYPVADATGCYYNFQHYDEGDRIITNEPCLNCTCHNKMLMCYLKVCPYTKAIGANCKVEKRSDQCCPVITCPEVPVHLLTSTAPPTAVGHLNEYGCSIDGLFYTDGARVPSSPNNPCELCYCIRNKTACVMQECTLNIDGCQPVYQEGVCCPVRYNCEHPDQNLLETSTTPLLTTTTTTTTTLAPTTASPSDCIYNNEVYGDGALIKKDIPCEQCYCMKGDVVCAVQECGPTPLDKVNCTALPVREGQCCPDTYDCEHIIEEDLSTITSLDVTTLQPEVITETEQKQATTVKPEFVTLEERKKPGQEEETVQPLPASTERPEEVTEEKQEITEEPAVTEKVEQPEKQGVTGKPEISEATEKQVEEDTGGQATEAPLVTESPIEAITARVTEILESVTARVSEIVGSFTTAVSESATEQSAATKQPNKTETPPFPTHPAEHEQTEHTPVEEEIPQQQTERQPEEEIVATTQGIEESEVTKAPESQVDITEKQPSTEVLEEAKPTESAEQQTKRPTEGEEHIEPEITHDEVPDEGGEEEHTEGPSEDEQPHEITEQPAADKEEAPKPQHETSRPEEEAVTTESAKAATEVQTEAVSTQKEELAQPTEPTKEGVEPPSEEQTEQDCKEGECAPTVTEVPKEEISEAPIVPAKCTEQGCELPVQPDCKEGGCEQVTQGQQEDCGEHGCVQVTESAVIIPEETPEISSGKPEGLTTEQAPVTVPVVHTTISEVPEITKEEGEPKYPLVKPTEHPILSETEQAVATEVPVSTSPDREEEAKTESEEIIVVTEISSKETSKPEAMDHIAETVLPVSTRQPEEQTTVKQPEATTEVPKSAVSEKVPETEVPVYATTVLPTEIKEKEHEITSPGSTEHANIEPEQATTEHHIQKISQGPEETVTEIAEGTTASDKSGPSTEVKPSEEHLEETTEQAAEAHAVEGKPEIETSTERRETSQEANSKPAEGEEKIEATQEPSAVPTETVSPVSPEELTRPSVTVSEEEQKVTEHPETVTGAEVLETSKEEIAPLPTTETSVEEIKPLHDCEGEECEQEGEEELTHLPETATITGEPVQTTTKVGTAVEHEATTERQAEVSQQPESITSAEAPKEVVSAASPESAEVPVEEVTVVHDCAGGEACAPHQEEVTEHPETATTTAEISLPPTERAKPVSGVPEQESTETNVISEEPVSGECLPGQPCVPSQPDSTESNEIPETPKETTEAPEEPESTKPEEEQQITTESNAIPEVPSSPECEGKEGDCVQTETDRPEHEVTTIKETGITEKAEQPEGSGEPPHLDDRGKPEGVTEIPAISVTETVETEPAGITKIPAEYENEIVPEEEHKLGQPPVSVTQQPESPATIKPEIEVTSEVEATTRVAEEEQITEEAEREIPGEGSCLVNGQTYRNNSEVPPINKCQVGCKCVSSILQCESINCDAPPADMANCMPVFQHPDSCCPTYSCTPSEGTSIPSDSHMMETTTTRQLDEKVSSVSAEQSTTEGGEKSTEAQPATTIEGLSTQPAEEKVTGHAPISEEATSKPEEITEVLGVDKETERPPQVTEDVEHIPAESVTKLPVTDNEIEPVATVKAQQQPVTEPTLQPEATTKSTEIATEGAPETSTAELPKEEHTGEQPAVTETIVKGKPIEQTPQVTEISPEATSEAVTKTPEEIAALPDAEEAVTVPEFEEKDLTKQPYQTTPESEISHDEVTTEGQLEYVTEEVIKEPGVQQPPIESLEKTSEPTTSIEISRVTEKQPEEHATHSEVYTTSPEVHVTSSKQQEATVQPESVTIVPSEEVTKPESVSSSEVTTKAQEYLTTVPEVGQTSPVEGVSELETTKPVEHIPAKETTAIPEEETRGEVTTISLVQDTGEVVSEAEVVSSEESAKPEATSRPEEEIATVPTVVEDKHKLETVKPVEHIPLEATTSIAEEEIVGDVTTVVPAVVPGEGVTEGEEEVRPTKTEEESKATETPEEVAHISPSGEAATTERVSEEEVPATTAEVVEEEEVIHPDKESDKPEKQPEYTESPEVGKETQKPVEETIVTSKPEEGIEANATESVFTSPVVVTSGPPEQVNISLPEEKVPFTSVPEVEVTTKPKVEGELSTSVPLSPEVTEGRPAATLAPPSHVGEHEHVPEIPEYAPPEEEYDDEDQAAIGPGTCRYGGKVYLSAQQIPRDDPCDFCFCFRSDIICLQQSCPPPIPRCHEEPIRGFCCPRYECPVNMATAVNLTTSTTTTTTTLPPHFFSHAYKGRATKTGCQIQGQAYQVGEAIPSASGPCLHCTCGGDGQMKCDPKACSPEPMMRKMLEAVSRSRR